MRKAVGNRVRNRMDLVHRRWVIGVVGLMCLGLAGAALHTFATLGRMRVEFLSNRGHEIASALDVQARGPGKRNNPAFWQALFEDNFERYSGKIAFLALVDQDGRILAWKGEPPFDARREISEEDGVYRFEEQLGRSRNRQTVQHPSMAGWRVQIGLLEGDADFIRRAAVFELAISILAVLVLLGLLIYLLRMLDRFADMKAAESAEAQLRSLGVMAASMAHEIRNPLGAIKGLTQLIQEDLPPDHESQGRLRTIVNEAERLEGLVSGLLDFARPKEPQLSHFDARQLLSEVASMLKPKLEESGVMLRIADGASPLPLYSDPAGLRQILLNVCINAIDASPPGSTVSVSILPGDNDGTIAFQIDDCGQGFGGRDPEEFFEPFVTTKARGTGLGLAISRQIAERLGGTIALSDNVNGGARCLIRLPAAAVKAPENQVPQAFKGGR